MTPDDLIRDCAGAINCGTHVVLTIPKGHKAKGFPRGELLNEMMRDGVIERTYQICPLKILKWIEKCQAA